MNKRRLFIAGVMTVLLTGTTLSANLTEKAAEVKTNAVAVKVQTTCPVMGGPIDKSKYVDYGGKRIYVCCGGCISKIKKDPAKYVRQLEAEGITLDKPEAPKAK